MSYPASPSAMAPDCHVPSPPLLGRVVPDAAELGPTFARFRVSTVDAEIATPFGAASDGEVEDHMITISGKK